MQKLIATSQSLMRSREVMHAENISGATGGLEFRQYSSLWKITDAKAVFKRCRELSKTTGFIEWVLFFKKLLFNDGFEVVDVGDARLKGEVERLVRDIWIELLIQNNVPAAWKQKTGTNQIPTVQILDCEGIKFENQFGEETLTIRYDPRAVSEAQRAKLGTRYAEALASGQDLIWGDGPGEGFAVLTNDKMGYGLGRPRLYAIFEELALHGLLTKGDWNAAWTAKDVIRQFKKGHEISGGNMAGMPIHFLKATERDAIHKAVKDKQGAFDIVTNFDVEVAYPAFDFKFFTNDKYEGVRQRLMEWSGPIGGLYVDDGRKDDETLIAILRAEMDATRADVQRIFSQIVTADGFDAVKSAKLKWSDITLLGMQRVISLVNTMVGNGVMSKITGRKILRLDDAVEGANLKKEHADPEAYTPSFEPFQGQIKTETPPTPEGGRPTK